MSFKEALDSGKFVVTTQVGAPRGTNIDKMIQHIDLLKDKVDGLIIADNQSAEMGVPSLVACHLIKERGGESILQLTCRDKNRLALQSELIGASLLGINNLICITGDYVTRGNNIEAKPVFDLDAVQLLQTVRLLEQGKDLGGNELSGAVKFCTGAMLIPDPDTKELQLINLEKKIQAGAEFFLACATYNMEKFKQFMSYTQTFRVKIIAAVLLLASAEMARYWNDTVPGISITQELIDDLAGAKRDMALEKGIEIASEMIKRVKEETSCSGVHIMAPGEEGIIPEILATAGIR